MEKNVKCEWIALTHVIEELLNNTWPTTPLDVLLGELDLGRLQPVPLIAVVSNIHWREEKI